MTYGTQNGVINLGGVRTESFQCVHCNEVVPAGINHRHAWYGDCVETELTDAEIMTKDEIMYRCDEAKTLRIVAAVEEWDDLLLC